MRFLFFFLNDPAPTEIYPLSLHDALPIPPEGRELSLDTPFSFRTRVAALESMAAEPVDVLVIGGGETGAGERGRGQPRKPHPGKNPIPAFPFKKKKTT